MSRSLLIIFLLVNSVLCYAAKPLPVTGSWINLFYQDVRNKYTNPEHLDNTDPDLWRAKVDQMHRMGVEYLVFMAVANEGLADYPSEIMPHAYPEGRISPVSAIMEQAEKNGMKVFLSIGWAENQDDNLKRPKILNRQLQIMDELAGLYGDSPAFYGWYLPVEDCLGPVLPETSVTAVNRLVARAKELTPGKKTMISPYGFFCSDFSNPKFAERIESLKVDIIAYQDEVGCVREDYPLPRLRENWKKIREIHDKTNIELWANCELFTWEKSTNSRSSALVPASINRILSQLQAATAGGVERIISFMVCGILDDGSDCYNLGQPQYSKSVAEEYKEWLSGNEKYDFFENTLNGTVENKAFDASNPLFDNVFGDENPDNTAWQKLQPGFASFDVNTHGCEKLYLRFLDCHKRGISLPYKISLSTYDEAGVATLVAVKDVVSFPNNLHDAWIECVTLPLPSGVSKVKVDIHTDMPAMIDEIVVE